MGEEATENRRRHLRLVAPWEVAPADQPRGCDESVPVDPGVSAPEDARDPATERWIPALQQPERILGRRRHVPDTEFATAYARGLTEMELSEELGVPLSTILVFRIGKKLALHRPAWMGPQGEPDEDERLRWLYYAARYRDAEMARALEVEEEDIPAPTSDRTMMPQTGAVREHTMPTWRRRRQQMRHTDHEAQQ